MPSFTLINSSFGKSGADGGTFSSTPASFVGSQVLFACAICFDSGAGPTFVDNGGNSWINHIDVAGNSLRLRAWYTLSPITLASQFITLTGATQYGAGILAGWSGNGAAETPGTNVTGVGIGCSASSVPLTPTTINSLIISCLGFNNVTTGLTINEAMTIQRFVPYTSAENFPLALAWKEQTVVAAINPHWDWEFQPASTSVSSLHIFKPVTVAPSAEQTQFIVLAG